MAVDDLGNVPDRVGASEEPARVRYLLDQFHCAENICLHTHRCICLA